MRPGLATALPPRILAAAAGLVLAGCAAALLLGACGAASGSGAAGAGGTSLGAASPAASQGAVAGSRALQGTVEQAAAEYWRLVGAGDYEAVAAASVPGEPPSATAATDDIAVARLVAVDRVDEQGDAGTLAQVRVYVEPRDGDQPTPWGETGEHTLFMHLRAAPGGGWLVESWGTGP